MKESDFTKNVEKLVKPIDVGTLHFIQNFTGSLPLSIQEKLISQTAQKSPYMGFVVEPYSFFLAYEIKDINRATKMLSTNFELVKTRILLDDEPKYYGIFGLFNAHTSGFWGMRLEFYIIARNKKTGLLSWVIIDYDTNTIGYTPKKGLVSANATTSFLTIDYDGIVYADVKKDDGSRKLIFQSDIKRGVMKALDKKLWIEGNLSIAYGKELSKEQKNNFSLKFNPKEFVQALEIPIEDVEIESNDWFPGLLKDSPTQILCFPYAQHLLSDSPKYHSEIKNEEQLKSEINKLDFNEVKVFTTSAFKKVFILGAILSFMINLLLLIAIFMI